MEAPFVSIHNNNYTFYYTVVQKVINKTYDIYHSPISNSMYVVQSKLVMKWFSISNVAECCPNIKHHNQCWLFIYSRQLLVFVNLRVVYSPTYKDHSTASIQCKANSFTIAAAVFYLLLGQWTYQQHIKITVRRNTRVHFQRVLNKVTITNSITT